MKKSDAHYKWTLKRGCWAVTTVALVAMYEREVIETVASPLEPACIAAEWGEWNKRRHL